MATSQRQFSGFSWVLCVSRFSEQSLDSWGHTIMLNGKFYTGLPPKMVERQQSKVCNRQESHFFWPDDTQQDSAVETRVKRRSSLQYERPSQLKQTKRLSSVQDDPSEVDTRQMFHKEFAKSSIQFYDNLQPTNNSNNSVRSLRAARREVTPKLTEIAPQLKNATPASGEDTSARRQQAYSSKIQFYDYVNEADSSSAQNNTRRPKMDRNDKREVELNTKNSPKLQVKRNVRSLSVELEPMVTKKPLNDNDQETEWQPERRRPLPMPKKILKHQESKSPGMDYMEKGMRQLRLRSPAPQKKHVTYNEEAAEYAYYEDREGVEEERHHVPNMSTGSRQPQHRPYGETSRSPREAKSLNNNKNLRGNYYTNNYNNSSTNSRKILPNLPETTSTTRYSDDTPTTIEAVELEAPAPSDPRKHLRSSLCFSGDALMVGEPAAASSSTALARRSSAGQRISVGLPD